MDQNPRNPSSPLPDKPNTPPSAPPVSGPVVDPLDKIELAGSQATPESAPVLDATESITPTGTVATPRPEVVPQPVTAVPSAASATDSDAAEAISPSILPGDPVVKEPSLYPAPQAQASPEPGANALAAAKASTPGTSATEASDEAAKVPDSAKPIPHGIVETHEHEHKHEEANVGGTPNESHTSNKTKLLIALAILVLLLGVGGGIFGMLTNKRDTSADSDGPVKLKVGVMMAFSGGSSSMGYGAMKGINLAKKQLDANNIDIVQMDSKCEAKSAATAIKQLIAQKVVAIIGEGCSSASVAALPAANNAKVVMISPSASSPTLSIPNDYFYRVVPPDTLQGSFMAQHIYNKGLRNVAVFYTDEPYGSGMNQVFREKFEALGGKIVKTASAEPDVIDLDTQVKTLKDAKPQAIFIAPNSVVSATAIIKLLRGAGVSAPLYGADIMYDTTIIQNGGTAAEGLTISSFPTGTKSFKQALTNENKKTEQLYAAPQAYDIIHVLQLAAQKGATNGEQIKNVLPSISFDGVSGPIAFDKNGEISNIDYKYDLFQVKGGEFVVQE